MDRVRPQISIVTVNYNGFADTCELIESLQQYATFSYELIVVDNASVKDESTLIRNLYPSVTCIRSEKNLGFAGGNNLGIKEAKGDFIFLLNNDTYITDDSLISLTHFLESHPQAGAVSPKIKFAEFPDEIQFAGYSDLSAITQRNHSIGFGEKDEGQYDNPTQTYFLHGAAMMIPRNLIEKVGLMSEIFFLYYEELDWCKRIRENGYELWYVPTATIYHKESKSVGQKSALKNFYMTRNRLLYAWRHSKGLTRCMTITYQLLIALPKNVIVSLLQKRTDLAKAAIKGALNFFKIKDKTI